MSLEKVFEIINENKYEKITFEKLWNPVGKDGDVYEIHISNGAFIRITYNWYLKGTILFGHTVDYCNISFFIPTSTNAVKTFVIEENDYNFDKLYNLKQDLKMKMIEEYF